jgi:hypothetical protein
MSVETKTNAGTAIISGSIYLEYWVQADAGPDLIYGTSTTTGALNILGARARTSTGQAGGISTFYKNPDPGEYDNGESNPAWYGQAIRVPFTRTQPYDQWHTLRTDAEAFIESCFPDHLIFGINRRGERPQPGDIGNPAKYVLWTLEYD